MVTKEPLFDNDGKPVPLFPDQRAITFEGRYVGYVNAKGDIAFIVPETQLTAPVVAEARALVAKEFQAGGKCHIVPDVVEPEEDDEWEDDEDE